VGFVLAGLAPEVDRALILKHLPVPRTAWQWAAGVPEIILSAFAEELVLRGYLIPRLERVLKSTGEAVLVGAILFGLGHGYQGVHGVVEVALFGLVYGSIFAVTRRIWPLAIGHAAWNVFVFVT